MLQNATAAAGEAVEQPRAQSDVSFEDFYADLSGGAVRDELTAALTTDHGLSGALQLNTPSDTLRTEDAYTDLLQLWGGLKACDTLAAAGMAPASLTARNHSSAIDAHVEGLDTASKGSLVESLNQQREFARKSTLEAVDDVAAEPGLYTVTLPTGGGKTLTGTQAALRLREQASTDAPIIYALPYTSIIDQTAQVFSNLFNADTQTDQLGVHHHLALIDEDSGSDTHSGTGIPTTDSLSRQARDAWLADVTLTTTVQLWESLAGPTRAQAPKLPSLYHSTIVLDEPQVLPMDWWPAVEILIDTLIESFGARVILMSATQPSIDTNYSPTVLADSDTVDLPARVTYRVDESISGAPVPHQTAGETIARDFVDEASSSSPSSVLAICNTIESAQELMDEARQALTSAGTPVVNIHDLYRSLADPRADTIEESLPDPNALADAISSMDKDAVLTCPLTTRHRPCDRSRILDGLSVALDPETPSPRILAVTTQLIEAGVDISFDSLYRDLAPYDTIIQAAGRCNREYERGIGNGSVTIWQLAAPPGQSTDTPPSELIYSKGVNVLDTTREVLYSLCDETPATLAESEVVDAEQKYQNRVHIRRPGESDVSSAIKHCDGAELTNASIIENRPSVSAIISMSEPADTLIEKYHNAASSNDFSTVASVLPKLRTLQVDLPEPAADQTAITSLGQSVEEGLVTVRRRQVEKTDTYLSDHGAQHPTSTVESRIYE